MQEQHRGSDRLKKTWEKYEEASAKASVFSGLKLELVHHVQRHLNEAIIF